MSGKVTIINRQHREINVIAIFATKPEFFVTKDEMLVALAASESQFRALDR